MPTIPDALSANIACVCSMFIWALAFPISDYLLVSWGVISLATLRICIGVSALLLVWIVVDGWTIVVACNWRKGLWIGGFGFGAGTILFLLGQKWSNAVTPAIAAAMMPIFGAFLEVVLDGKHLTGYLVIGIILAISGGILAAGTSITDASFGLGALLCLVAVVLFAWSTKAIIRNFPTLSTIGKTTIPLVGAALFLILSLALTFSLEFNEAKIGLTDNTHMGLLLFSALFSLALSHTLWIWAAANLGILLASFHMNAVPFYVMVIVSLFLNEEWHWLQASGGLLVAAGVYVAQMRPHRLNAKPVG